MKRDWSQITIMLSGAFLVIFGVGAIVFDMLGPSTVIAAPQSMRASAEGFVATTHYVGLEVVMVGAVLEIVGFLGGSYSKRSALVPSQQKRINTNAE
jgi:steroid 5-alpha reductase family enzyme